MTIDHDRLKELERKSNGRQRPSETQKKDMPDWMSEDEGGLYHYVLFRVGDNYYALDDDYMDVDAGVSDFFRDTKVQKNVFGLFSYIRKTARYLVDLPKLLGYNENFHEKSVVFHIKPKKVGGDIVSLVINHFPEKRIFEKMEIVDPREFGDYSFPDYVPRVIDTDKGIVQVLDLGALLKQKIDYGPASK